MSASVQTKVLRILVIFALLALLNVPTASYASSAACTVGNYRAADFSDFITVAKGMQGVLRTPVQGEITGLATGRASAADVYIINGADYIQVGWYMGNASQLPYSSVPRFFVGEYYPGQQNNEVLRAGPTLSWGTYYSFSLDFTSPAGHYNFYLQGQFRYQTLRAHFTSGYPAFNGETTHSCVRMEARAHHYAAPQRTLQYLTYDSRGAVWHWFSDSYTYSSGYYMGRAGDIATAYGYGGG
jgi:hypothetical protein